MMEPYQNRAWLQGRIATAPVLKDLNSRTRLSAFTLSVVESWLNDEQQPRSRTNTIYVEVVGRDAERIAREASVNMWATIEGYIRTEEVKGSHVTKIRTLSITLWKGPA